MSMDKNRDLNWAVLGTGVIANEMAQALVKMNKRLYAVANRTHQKLWILPKDMVCRRYMIRLMRYLKMRR